MLPSHSLQQPDESQSLYRDSLRLSIRSLIRRPEAPSNSTAKMRQNVTMCSVLAHLTAHLGSWLLKAVVFVFSALMRFWCAAEIFISRMRAVAA